MNIVIGSKNPTKINAVHDVFKTDKVVSLDAKSDVSDQPLSDEETRLGAINRAKACAKSAPHSLGIGLEGGVMQLNDDLYLCNWGALVTADGTVFTASGARIILPKKIAEQLKTGAELGDLMDEYTHKTGVRNEEGAIGVFTNNLISRKKMFTHIVTLLKGQWEYFEKEQ